MEDVTNLLKRYDVYEKAELICEQHKLNRGLYNMQERYEVYCNLLMEIFNKMREKKMALEKRKCCKWDDIVKNHELPHDDCFSICEFSHCKKVCEERCDYYRKEIEPLEHSMAELQEAMRVLKEEAEKDRYMR